MVKEYVEEIVRLFRMDTANREYFLSRVSDHPIEIQMFIGLKGQETLLTTVWVEQINCLHPWELPNVTIQRNPADQQLLLVGKLDINSELLDEDAPTFHIHWSRIGEFKLAHGVV